MGQAQGSVPLLALSLHPQEGPLLAHDYLGDISKGSRGPSLFSFGGKPFSRVAPTMSTPAELTSTRALGSPIWGYGLC